jgi:lipoate-protein ligase A
MKRLDLTLPTAAENVALDEALLEAAEAGAGVQAGASGVLRFWESATPIVVLGRSSRAADEARLDQCARAGAAVVRRASGGAAIVSGPGCLMYALVLSHAEYPELRSVDAAHRLVLARMVEGLKTIVPNVSCRGTSDLVMTESVVRGSAVCDTAGVASDAHPHRGDKKFSGNSLRCKRNHLLYHGTLLYDFDLTLVERLLATPPRQPAYRAGRPHGAFIRNLPATAEQLRAALCAVWQANEPLADWPQAETARLAAEKYSLDAWNLEGAV